MANRKRAESTAAHVRDQVLRSRDRAWMVQDFPGYAASAVSVALARLADEGELRRVRRGLYWRGVRHRWGMSLPDPMVVARKLAGDGVGWTGVSAANVLGLTTQVPAVEQIAVPGPAPVAPPGARFISRLGRASRIRARLSPQEVAVMEVLRQWDRVVDIPQSQAVSRLAALVSDGEVRADKLVTASVDETGPTRERLRTVLDKAGRVEAMMQVATSPRSGAGYVQAA